MASITDETDCCINPDIQLTVDCATIPGSIQWQWHTEVEPEFNWGFCMNYDCKPPTDGDYCYNDEDHQV